MNKTAILLATLLTMGAATALAQPGPGGPGGPEGPRSRGGFRGGSGGNLMQALDLNSDGTLDSREIQAAPMSLRKLDKNKDFKLTPDELGGRGGPGGDISARMLEMDKNKDGKLTSDEVPERMGRFIERMDTNGDGAVDKAEIQAFQEEMRKRWEEGGGDRDRGDRGDRGGRGDRGDRGEN